MLALGVPLTVFLKQVIHNFELFRVDVLGLAPEVLGHIDAKMDAAILGLPLQLDAVGQIVRENHRRDHDIDASIMQRINVVEVFVERHFCGVVGAGEGNLVDIHLVEKREHPIEQACVGRDADGGDVLAAGEKDGPVDQGGVGEPLAEVLQVEPELMPEP